ncbi:MAG: PIN domain-containing protein [Bifidobacteriaceae bacterium]|nr:PIN domain-containing protein [Bifidobacteriaceae bacterium]
MSVLIDANVLIALVTPAHVHHRAACAWRDSIDETYATCPITQAALVRFAIREGAGAADAIRLVEDLESHPRHQFWPDDVPLREVRMTGVVGHRQVADAYLAQLARRHDAKFATFDQGVAAQHSDVAWLIPESPASPAASPAE